MDWEIITLALISGGTALAIVCIEDGYRPLGSVPEPAGPRWVRSVGDLPPASDALPIGTLDPEQGFRVR